jgi:hypothetical protein
MRPHVFSHATSAKTAAAIRDMMVAAVASGTGGNATINNGPFAGQDFNVHSSDNVLSCAGQLDVGGRYAINSCWSVNFGYRVVGLSGVAISEVNAIHNQFQNVDGIRSQQTTGSFILHGGFVGATYCW